jgi:hypothetical protein
MDLKTQKYYKGNIKSSWFANLNLQSYIKDKQKGIDIFSFLFFNPNRKELIFVGSIDYAKVPELGFLVKAEDDFGNGNICREDCYNIRLDRLRIS